MSGHIGAAAAQPPVAIATPPSGSIYNSTAAAIGKVLKEKAGLPMTLQAMGGSRQPITTGKGATASGAASSYSPWGTKLPWLKVHNSLSRRCASFDGPRIDPAASSRLERESL